MRLLFAQPHFLYLAIPLVLHALWMGRRLKSLAPARRWTAITLRSLVLLLILAALSGARIAKESKDLSVFFLLDASDSVPAAQKSYANAYIKKTLLEMGKDDRAGVVVFGETSAVERAPTRDSEFENIQSVVSAKGTNIADAIQLAMACFVGESQKRIVLLSDGNQNAGDAEAAAQTVKASRVALDVLPLKYENRNDVILDKVMVENRVSLDQPFDLKIIATARESGNAKLSLHQDGKLIGNFDVKLEADKKNSFVIPTQVRDSGFHTFEAQLHADGDLIPDNNRGFAFTYGEGEPHVLLVDGDASPSRALPSVLTGEKLQVEVVDATGLPSNLRDLENYDAVIFNNVPAGDVSETQMKLIETAVHDLGLGFIMIGGENSFGPGGYNDSPIERILPVEMEMKNDKILPQGALVPIIHTVEIPQGEFWAEKIVQAALDVLSPRDLMGVLYYSWNGGETWLYKLQEVGNKTKMRNMLNGIQPGDMPSFDSTLQMAYDALVPCGASVKHIVVISDGDPQTPNQALAMKIKAAKITISTVCIAPHSPRDSATLQSLAKWGGGNFYEPTQFDKLPQIFVKEAATVRKSLIFEEPFTPVVKSSSPLLPGIGDSYPILRGNVGSSAKSLADVPLTNEKDDPLLAHWQHGVGKTVAFTSDAKERWASKWLDWQSFSKFWSQTVRWSLRSPYNKNYQIETVVDGSRGKIIIDAVDSKGEFRNFVDIKGRVVAPSLEAQDVTFRQVSAGRYEADFNAQEPGTYMFSAQAGSESGDEKDLVTGGTALSYSPEFQSHRSNEQLLYRLTDISGGRVLDENSPVFLHNLISSAEPRDLWPILLTIAMILFLFDVFTRRVLIGWSEIAGGVAWVFSGVRERYGWKRLDAEGVTATGQLRKSRESARATETPPAAREDFLASLKQSRADTSSVLESLKKSQPSDAGKSLPGSTAPKSKPADSKANGDEGGHTSQLLKARLEAKRKFRKKDDA